MQIAVLLHTTPDATFTTIARIYVGTLTAIATAITPTTMNVKWRTALVSAPWLSQ
jgi:hypothetical protein